MHAANRAAWDEAAERYEGWFDEAVALIRAGGSNLFPVEHDLIGDLRGRCRRAIHLQCAGGRDTLSLWNLGADEVVGRRLQPADARPRAAAHRGDRRPGDLGGGRRPRRARTTSTGRRTSSTRAAARSSGSRTSTRGPRSCAACWRPAGGSSSSTATRPSGCSTGTARAAGPSPTTTTSAAPRRRGAGRRSTSTASRSPTTSSTRSSPGPGPWARSSPRCSAPGCGSSASPSTRSTGGPGHRDVRPDERGRVPLSFSVVATRG